MFPPGLPAEVHSEVTVGIPPEITEEVPPEVSIEINLKVPL